MSDDITIELASDLTAEDVEALRRYLADSFRLSDQEWQRLRAAIDRLSHSTVVFGGRHTFSGSCARTWLGALSAL